MPSLPDAIQVSSAKKNIVGYIEIIAGVHWCTSVLRRADMNEWKP